MDFVMDPPPSEEDLARWRREFEAARSFEDSDDAKYFRSAVDPVEETPAIAPPKPTAATANVPNKNVNPRLAALQNSGHSGRVPGFQNGGNQGHVSSHQNSGIQGHAPALQNGGNQQVSLQNSGNQGHVPTPQSSDTQGRAWGAPPQRTTSLPRQYDPRTHGAWRPSGMYAVESNKHASLADAKRFQQQLGQPVQEAGAQTQSHGYTTLEAANTHYDYSHEGYIAEANWQNIPAYMQRDQPQEHLGSRQLALASFVPRGPRTDLAVQAHNRNNSEESISSESVPSGQAVKPPLTGGNWTRNGQVWKATYGGNFTGGT